MKKWRAAVLSLALFGAACFAFAERYSELQVFARALNLIEKHYFKPVEMELLIYGAARGLLREIDPYYQFFSPGEVEDFQDRARGKFYGVGMEVEKKRGRLTVIFVLDGSPAARAGFKEGDQILKINGKEAEGLAVWEAAGILRSGLKGGARHKVSVSRPGGGKKPLAFLVKPEEIKLPSVQSERLPEGFFYVRIVYFSRTTTLELNKILRKQKLRGLILDLRSNPGGIFDQAVQTADLFLDEGVIASYKIKSKPKKNILLASLSDTLPAFPMVVLINEYSASGSEILAGALKDHKRAFLMGRKTFGKGLIQDIFDLPGDSALKLTVGEYQTPSGSFIHGRGIEPHAFIKKRPEAKPSESPAPSKKSLLESFEISRAFGQLQKMAKK